MFYIYFAVCKSVKSGRAGEASSFRPVARHIAGEFRAERRFLRINVGHVAMWRAECLTATADCMTTGPWALGRSGSAGVADKIASLSALTSAPTSALTHPLEVTRRGFATFCGQIYTGCSSSNR